MSNVHPLEVLTRYRDSQLQVDENENDFVVLWHLKTILNAKGVTWWLCRMPVTSRARAVT